MDNPFQELESLGLREERKKLEYILEEVIAMGITCKDFSEINKEEMATLIDCLSPAEQHKFKRIREEVDKTDLRSALEQSVSNLT